MDPLSIASACVGITAGLSTLMMRIGVFVSEVKSARKDMDAVHRELSSLQLCLNALRSDELSGKSSIPADLRAQINQILVNIEMIINQINDMLIKLSSGRLGRRIQWATTEKNEMNQLRSSLESNKAALEIALTVGTISILVDQRSRVETQEVHMAEMTQMMKVITVESTNMSGKLDNILTLQRQKLGLTDIQAALDDLRSELVAIVGSGTKNTTLQNFSGQAMTHVETLLVTVSNEMGPVLDIPKAIEVEPSRKDLDHRTGKHTELDPEIPSRTCIACIACKQDFRTPGSFREMRDYQKKCEDEKENIFKHANTVEHVKDLKQLEQDMSEISKLSGELAEISGEFRDIFGYDYLEKELIDGYQFLRYTAHKIRAYKLELKKRIHVGLEYQSAQAEKQTQKSTSSDFNKPAFQPSQSADHSNAHREKQSSQSSVTQDDPQVYQAHSQSQLAPKSVTADTKVPASRSLAGYRMTHMTLSEANVFAQAPKDMMLMQFLVIPEYGEHYQGSMLYTYSCRTGEARKDLRTS